MSDDLTIHVTAEDIAWGVPDSPCGCAVARAARRATGAEDVRVGRWHMAVYGVDYVLPEDASDFIRAFDAGETVKPFTFTAEKRVDRRGS